jgi:5'-methylthioadenosine phosphorylase
MKAVLDHVGIAVRNLEESLAFFRDALGLEVEPSQDVASQQVRAQFIPTGAASLELLEATAPGSPIASFLERRGPGLHHITLRVDDIRAALRQLKDRQVRLVDEEPRPGAEGSIVAFIHPSSTHGVLVELKQATPLPSAPPRPETLQVGDVQLTLLCDGYFHLDGGAMFGVIPKPMWEKKAAPDGRNRIRMAMRPVLVDNGSRKMLIDAGCGDKMTSPKQAEIYGFEREFNLTHSLEAAGVSPEAIDIVLASHLHFDHAGGFTSVGPNGVPRPRFPRAQYVVRRGEWDDAHNVNERTKATYFLENFQPLADSHVLQLVDDDQTIMPGVRVQRTGGHTMHHQMALIESGGKTAVFAADLLPTAAHLPEVWIMGYDLFPLDTLDFKRAFLREAVEREYLILFEHDPDISAAYIRQSADGKRYIERVMKAQIGVIGGSGLYDMADLTDREELSLKTPFGDPSGPYLVGTLRGRRVAFLARHGAGHRLLPSELNFRANIFGFKVLGVERILSASAVGSLKQEYPPLDIVVPDQFFDRTKSRISTFFGSGLAAHVSFAHPICPELARIGADAVQAVGATVHRGGTYVCMEGPQFSTLAESKLYRSWGMDVIGMTNLQEAKLAREAEMCYVTLALVTDYDCWHPDHDSVTVEIIVQTLLQNAKTAQLAIAEAIAKLPDARSCGCGSALKHALITRPEAVPEQVKQHLAPIIGKYFK